MQYKRKSTLLLAVMKLYRHLHKEMVPTGDVPSILPPTRLTHSIKLLLIRHDARSAVMFPMKQVSACVFDLYSMAAAILRRSVPANHGSFCLFSVFRSRILWVCYWLDMRRKWTDKRFIEILGIYAVPRVFCYSLTTSAKASERYSGK